MKAVVTGASGFVGRHLRDALRDAGWRVATLDRSGPADHVGDLRTMPLRGIRADVVFHLAAFANPSASVDAAADVYASNAAATARLARELPAGRLVFPSTCQVYAPADRPLDEGAPLGPRNPYAASKLCAEALALAAKEDVVILRPFNHTGPGQSAAYVCPSIARQIARAEAGGPRRLEIKNGAPRVDFFDVRDMARAYLLAAERGVAGRRYNVGTGRPVSIETIARTLRGMSRVPLELRAGRGPASTLSGDASLFQRDTGWRPEIPLRRTLSDLLDDERRQVTVKD
ncbi:MAG TPA: NAD-dependent epimerase/dehydratase family protein [Planctomycetota bacterium]